MDPACWLIGGEFEDSVFEERPERRPGPPAPYGAKRCEPQWFDEETESSDDVEVLTVKKFRGDLAYRRQEYQKALQEYSSISEKLSSTNFAMKRDVQEGQARCLAHLGRHTEALEIATNLENKATNTDHLSTVLYLQFAICSSWPNLERTISCLQKLIALHPFDPWTWSKLAEAYLSLGPAPSASVASPQGHDGFLSSDEAVKSAFPHLGRDCLLCLPELLPQSSVFSIKARSSNGQKYENTLKSIPSCMAEKREAVLPETLVKACASLIRASLLFHFQDQLAADMYNFMAKEGEYGKFFVTLLEAQADYHRKALAVLEKALPEMRAHQDKWAEKPAFGTPLEEHLKRSGREIALPIEACVMLLLETGMKEEGLFRIGAGASKLKKLKAALDCSTSHLDEFYSDPHAVAGALKSYLRELPEPLMTFNLYEEWTHVASVQDQDKKLQDLWRTCQKLPPHNFVNFRYLIKFLAKLAQTSDVNKMTPSNIAIVLGPNLLWAKNEGTLAEIAAATSVHVVAVIEPIIQHADWFFPEEVEFNVSEAFVPLATPNSNHSSSHTGSDCDSGAPERKRPASMAVMEGDLVKKESFGVKLMDFQAHRRSGTLNRKHVAPAFQPPLPPTDGSTLVPAGPEPPAQSARAESSSGGGTVPSSAGIPEQGPGPGDSSPPKPKDSMPAAVPASGRSSSQTTPSQSQGQAQSGAGSHQLSVGSAHSAAGPSPHTLRRAVKKPAPAPPKPGNAPPGHPGGQSSPGSSQPAPNVSPKPAARSPSPPPQHSGQVLATAQPSAPRRYSSSLSPIQAPSHPPPQPPTQATPQVHTRLGSQGGPSSGALPGEQGLEQLSHTPPQTPTPPSTPPLGKQNLSLLGPQPQAVSSPETAQPHTGTLPRPRPVPKPRNRPSMPPPPHPPGAYPAGDSSLTGVTPTASKIVTDTSSRVSDPLRSVFPETHSDSASKDVPGHILLDIDNDTESTAL